jgi:hypothetical protein
MKTFLQVILVVGFCNGMALAQYNLSTTYCGHNDLNGARYEPSELDLGKKKHFQFGMNTYVWFGNTATTYQLFANLYQGQSTSIADMVAAQSKLNLLGFGLDVQLGGIAWQFKTKQDKHINFSLTAVDKLGYSFQYGDNLAKLVAFGNKQFAGQLVDLGSTNINALYYREYALGTAFPLFGNDGDGEGIGMRFGFRVKYLQGITSAKMTMRRATLFTPEDGSYIETSLDYTFETAGVTDFQNFSPVATNGTGFGADFGAALHIGKKIEVNASLMDLGAITFDKQVTTFSKNGTFRYQGQTVGYFFGDFNLSDSLYFFTPDQTKDQGYSQSLASRFLVQAEFKTPKVSEKGREYISNAIFVTYVQGFRNVPGSTTRPFVSVAYNRDLHKTIDAGLMVGYGGYNQLIGGGFASISILNFLKFGIGSDNIIPLLLKTRGTGVDFQTNFSLTF